MTKAGGFATVFLGAIATIELAQGGRTKFCFLNGCCHRGSGKLCFLKIGKMSEKIIFF